MIGGKHTYSEVRDLLAQYEWRIDQLNAALIKSPANQQTLNADWQAFLERWVKARDEVKRNLIIKPATNATNLIPGAGLIPDTDEEDFQAILKAGSPTYPSYTDKDLPGLEARITDAVPGFQWSKQPENVALDYDLIAYNQADKAAKAVEQGGRAVVQAAKTNYKTIAVIGFTALGALILAKKLRLL